MRANKYTGFSAEKEDEMTVANENEKLAYLFHKRLDPDPRKMVVISATEIK